MAVTWPLRGRYYLFAVVPDGPLGPVASRPVSPRAALLHDQSAKDGTARIAFKSCLSTETVTAIEELQEVRLGYKEARGGMGRAP